MGDANPSASLKPEELAVQTRPGLYLLPVIHERIDMAAVVQMVLNRLQPAAVAVELPATLATLVQQAVRRLPKISLVVSEQEGEDALVWAVAPGDPFAEAVRWAQERDCPVFCIDPDLPYRERHRDPIPDPYALWSLGAAAYLDLLVRSLGNCPVETADSLREAGMVYYLQQAHRAAGMGTLLALVGAAHADRVRAQLAGPAAQPLARVRRVGAEVRHLHPRSLPALLPDPPLAHAVFELVRTGESPPEPNLESTLARRVALSRHGLRLIAGASAGERAERRQQRVRYAANRASVKMDGTIRPDRRALERIIWQVAAGSYEEQTQETLRAWQWRTFSEFARRYARVEGLLVPGLYEWVVAARGVADDNLAWEVFDAAATYPWQEERAEIPTAEIHGEELDLGTRKVRFRRRFFRVKQRPVAVPVRERPDTDDPDQWLRAFQAGGLCSYPPEDLVIEDYGRFLQHKAISLLSAENRRSEPFSTSLLDGIDIRETLRNVHEGRIYVHELGRVPGEAGSVVVIFDRDRDHSRFPFLMTWHGEHTQESDMAFYASHPAEQVVGPGIMRATYGGFMLTSSPGRLLEVWSDPEYRDAREKAEVLIMAAVDYSLEKIVVHVAAAPPSERMRSYATHQQKRLVHIPLGSLSPGTLKKVRVVHLLVGHDKRSVAKDYIW